MDDKDLYRLESSFIAWFFSIMCFSASLVRRMFAAEADTVRVGHERRQSQVMGAFDWDAYVQAINIRFRINDAVHASI